MLATPEQVAVRVHCPRCDYDLDGAVAAFTEQCPLQGTCSECGMAFEWANLLRADRQQLPWLFEHTRRPGRGFLATLWCSLFPARFWSRVKMWHVPVKMRLWTFAIVCGGGLSVAISLLLIALHLLVAVMFGKGGAGSSVPTWQVAVVDSLLYPFAVEQWWGNGWVMQGIGVNWSFIYVPILCLWGINLSWPLMMLMLSESRRESRVKRVHVLRAWAYSMWWGVAMTIGLVGLHVMSSVINIAQAVGWARGSQSVMSLQQDVMMLLYQSGMERWALPFWALMVFLWTARWWWVVIVRYWQFSRPGVVYWLIFIVSLLSMLIPGVLGAPHPL